MQPKAIMKMHLKIFYSAFADVMIYSNYLQIKVICVYVRCYSK